MKKLVSIFVALALVLTNFQGWNYLGEFDLSKIPEKLSKFDLFGAVGKAEAYAGTLLEGTGLYYQIVGEEVIIADCDLNQTEAIIPAEIDGYPVTSIGSRAFYECINLKSIEIPNSVTSIGMSAFYGCNGLTSIKIPNSVTSIGSWTFYSCNGLKSIEISNSVEYIAKFTFYGCLNLTSIKMPNNLINIGEGAFRACGRLTSIEIPPSVTYIENTAFLYSGVKCIYGEKGSYAEKYANVYNIEFKSIESLYNVDNFRVLRISKSSLVLGWDKLDAALGYEIFRATTEDGQYKKVKTITDKNIVENASTGLAPATSYYYKIRAYYLDKDGNKVYGDYTPLKATTNPDKVTGLKLVNSTETSLRIGWDKLDYADGYEVFRGTSEKGTFVRVSTITDNNTVQNASPYLKAGTTYYYRVKSYIVVDGQKLYSDSATLTTNTKSFGPIKGLKMVNSTDSSIRIKWNPVSTVEGYEVFRCTTEDGVYAKVNTITDNTITETASTGLNPGTTYYYKVRSYKTIDGEKQTGDFTLVETTTKPVQVTGVVATSAQPKNVVLSWTKTPSAVGYEVFRATSADGAYVKVGSATTNTYKSSSAEAGKTYYYKVKAYLMLGSTKMYGTFSEPLKVSVK